MLLTICGSLRRASTNRLLLAEAARAYGGPTRAADIAMPLYDGDLEREEGVPAAARILFDRIASAEAVVIGSPEYNYGMSGALKNALDWVSRVSGNPWRGKPVAIVSAAAGRGGGARGAMATHMVMTHFKPLFSTGPDVLLSQSHGAFDEHGRLIDQRTRDILTRAMETLRDEARAALS